VHGDAGRLAVHELAFAGVQADPHLEPELGQRVDDGATAADGPGRTVEGGEEAVAGRVHLVPAKAHQLQLAAHELVVALEGLPPRPVA
jgi:hypothetical protein